MKTYVTVTKTKHGDYRIWDDVVLETISIVDDKFIADEIAKDLNRLY